MKTLIGLLLALLASHALAQGYPNKAVRVIISFTPASATDIVGRIVGAKLSEYWGQPVVAENRSGAGGSLGSNVVAQAAPDGYTLLINSNAHAVNPAIFAKLPYDTTKDFTDIAPLAELPNVLVVGADSRFKTLADLINFGKANPGKINFGHAGVGSGTHLNTVKLITAADIQVTQVPFKGTPEVVAAIFAGAVDCYWVPVSAGISNIRAGKLRALAVSTGKRSPLLPDLATTAESGVNGADFGLWFGLWGPAGMPGELVNKISSDTRRALADPVVRERLANTGNTPMDMSPQEFAKFVRSEIEDYARTARAAGIKPQ
ncbi:MAG: Bug family tripartite tricarboxylate transporter substrate binding protein [Burkholderiales bacterium]